MLANVKGQEIYNGASGAAIGGSNDDASEKAAEELTSLIMRNITSHIIFSKTYHSSMEYV